MPLDFKFPVQFEDTENSRAFNKKINEISNQIKIEDWSGNTTISTLFYIYLLNKYKNNCFLRRKEHFVGFEISFYGQEIRNNWSDDTGLDNADVEQTNPIFVVLQLLECIEKNVPIIIIPLRLKFMDENGIFIEGHMNLLIYRRKFNTIEHFEPHGQKFKNDEEITRKIKDWINNYIIEMVNVLFTQKYPEENDIQFIPSDVSCPISGFQTLENRFGKYEKNEFGYCAVWNHFFAELALCNPNLSSRDLMEKIYHEFNYRKKKTGELYLDIIRGYTRMINSKILKLLDILFKKTLTIKDLHGKFPNLWDDLKYELDLLVDIEMSVINTYENNIDNYISDHLTNYLNFNGWVEERNEKNSNTSWRNSDPNRNYPTRDIDMLKIARKLHKAIVSPTPNISPPAVVNKTNTRATNTKKRKRFYLGSSSASSTSSQSSSRRSSSKLPPQKNI